MFHHPQNIPSIIRTQRLLEQQEYSIIIRRPKEQIHWRRKDSINHQHPKVDGTTRIFHHHQKTQRGDWWWRRRIFHHHHHHHQRWSRLQRSVPPQSLWFEVFENPWSSIHHPTTTTIWSLFWLFGWLNPHDFGWNFFVFLWELMAMKFAANHFGMQPERSRERERENETHHTQWSFKLSMWVWVLWMSIRVSVVGLILESHLFVGVGFCFSFVWEKKKNNRNGCSCECV